MKQKIFYIKYYVDFKTNSRVEKDRHIRYKKYESDVWAFNTERDLVTFMIAFENIIKKISSIEELISYILTNEQQNSSTQSENKKVI